MISEPTRGPLGRYRPNVLRINGQSVTVLDPRDVERRLKARPVKDCMPRKEGFFIRCPTTGEACPMPTACFARVA